jgi:ABC-type phosphate/phosphonate transport system ATPase subunit
MTTVISQSHALDFFNHMDGGKNVVIIGAPRSGKSTLVKEVATAYASKAALVRAGEIAQPDHGLAVRRTAIARPTKSLPSKGGAR